VNVKVVDHGQLLGTFTGRGTLKHQNTSVFDTLGTVVDEGYWGRSEYSDYTWGHL